MLIMFKYKVVNAKTGEDITADHDWVISPSGELSYLMYGDLISYPDARAVPVIDCWDVP
jgi:hypothetical protein